MSTKTTFKRIALVAVASLGFGVLTSVAPAIAAPTDGALPYSLTSTIDNSTTTIAGRVGQTVSIGITAGIDAVTDAAVAAAAGSTSFAVVSYAAAITSQPATSAVYPSLTSVVIGAGSLSTIGLNLATAATATSSAGSATGTASSVATLNYANATEEKGTGAVAAGTSVATLSFVPTVAGTYSVTVWNEKDRAWGNAASSIATATSQASLSGSESYKVFTVNVSSGVSSVTLAAQNSSSIVSGTYGSLIKVSLKDAAGNAAILAPGETVAVTPSGSGDIAMVNGSAVTSDAGASYNLSSTNFNSSGIAWVNVTDAVAESVSLTATTSAGASASASVTFRTRTATAAASAPYPYAATRTAYISSGSATSVPLGASTTTFRLLGVTAADYNSFTITESLCSGVGAITGYTSALSYDAVGTAAATTLVSSVSVTASCASATQLYTVIESGTKTNTVSSVARAAGVLTRSPATVNASIGSTNTITATLADNFGAAYPNQTVTISVTGKNPTTTSATAVTDSLGKVSYALTDANTNTATQDVITFTSGSAVSTTISYGTNAVSTITLTSTGDTDVIPGTTTTDIDAGYLGATGTYATASAVVKNAAGALLAGVPVTFTVTGLVGAEVHTTLATVYTDTTGTAASRVSSYAAGKATVTATAGTITASDDIYFAQNTPEEARTVSASISGNVVTATVKDRYGNPVAGVTVHATRTGTVFFGTGASTTSGATGLNGTVDFIIGGGSGTVSVQPGSTTTASAVYGQTYAAAGYDADAVNGTAIAAAVAGTASVNQKGLGAALAPAGVNKPAAVTVEATTSAAETAADAAAEATDAANAATDAANAAAEAADAATAAAQDAADAVAALATSVTEMVNALKKQITSLTNLVIKIQKKVRA